MDGVSHEVQVVKEQEPTCLDPDQEDLQFGAVSEPWVATISSDGRRGTPCPFL